MFSIHSKKRVRRGVTLVELLVTVGIVVLLAAVSIPTFRGLSQGRIAREAARELGVALNAAQMQALFSGHASGLRIQRDPNFPQAGTALEQVQVPDPYSGEVQSAQAIVVQWPAYPPNNSNPFNWNGPGYQAVLKIMFRATDVAYPRVQVGDRIQFNAQGPYYQIVSDTNHAASGGNNAWPWDFPTDAQGFVQLNPSESNFSNGYMADYRLTAVLLLMPGPAALPYPTESYLNPAQYNSSTPGSLAAAYSNPLPFKIIRQPVATGDSPVRLDARAAIDLAFSGSDSGLNTISDTCSFGSYQIPLISSGTLVPDQSPVTIVFTPTGEVQSFWMRNVEYLLSRNPVYLLVGRRDRVPVDVLTAPVDPTAYNRQSLGAQDQRFNWDDPNNLWVTIEAGAGLITTSEVAAVTQLAGTNPPEGNPQLWKQSRIAFGAQGQTTGGR